jgi:hypothetical protein
VRNGYLNLTSALTRWRGGCAPLTIIGTPSVGGEERPESRSERHSGSRPSRPGSSRYEPRWCATAVSSSAASWLRPRQARSEPEFNPGGAAQLINDAASGEAGEGHPNKSCPVRVVPQANGGCHAHREEVEDVTSQSQATGHADVRNSCRRSAVSHVRTVVPSNAFLATQSQRFRESMCRLRSQGPSTYSWDRREQIVSTMTSPRFQVTFPSKLKGYDVVEPLTPASDRTTETGENDGR